MRAIQREQTRARIIDAAIEVFASHGYARATVDEIAENAGTTRTTFYLHFKTKAAILPELIARSSGHFDDLYRELADISVEPDVGQIRRWISSAMDRWADIADTARPLLEASMIEVGLRERVDRPATAQALLADALTRSVHIGNPEEAFIYATVLLAPLNHYFQSFLRGVDFDRDEVIDVLAKTWVAVMSATVATKP